MEKIKVSINDESLEVARGTSCGDVIKMSSKRHDKTILAAKNQNGRFYDLSVPIDDSENLALVPLDSCEGLEILRHSTAHLLAMAVQRLWPNTKVTIGPVIQDGFYYDFEFSDDVKISEKDFPSIEKEMRRILKEGHKIYREVYPRSEAMEKFCQMGESYKVEIISELASDEIISVYSIGPWMDLCKGPHVPKMSFLGAFKLMKIAGAYWRGNAENKMLTRIYGTAWKDQKDLEQYLNRLEEAKKRDHRIIGRNLDLFSFQPESPANAFFHEKGSILYQKLMSFMRLSNQKFGFSEVHTPLLLNVDLWHQSGHYDNYAENMYFVDRDDVKSALKPMNCPGHCLIYRSQKRSYRELPIKLAEFGRVHRHEKSGVVNGLFRVRSFVQDDAHIFCTQTQLPEMIQAAMTQIGEVYKTLGFSRYTMELSTRPEKATGSIEMWDKAENILSQCLRESGIDYRLNPGDGAFYGPKIDFHLVDALGRSWQCGTIQLDFSMPQRCNLLYVSKDNTNETPVMIHRAVLGSFERFIGVLLEHTAGHLPLWCVPEHVRVVSVSQAHEGYANQVMRELMEKSVRVSIDTRNEKLGYKIRESQLKKIPYTIIIGDKEVKEKVVSPRFRDGTQEASMNVETFIDKLKNACGDLWQL